MQVAKFAEIRHSNGQTWLKEFTMWSEFSFMLKPSQISGIGVFATHDIKIGAKLFNNNSEARVLKVKDIPAPLLQYCIYINDDEVLGPERFDRMEIGWYINHSSTPNIAKKKDASNKSSFVAIRDIKAGDEILIDYNTLDEPEHLKEDYYKIK